MGGLDPTVQVALATGGFALLTTVVRILAEMLRRQGRAIGQVREDTAASRDQVENNHESNLRDDVDKVLARLALVLDGQERHGVLLNNHAADIAGLREEIRLERRERLSVEDRLDTHLAGNAT